MPHNPFHDPKDTRTIHISTLTIFKVLLVFLLLAFVYLVWDVIVLLFVSLIMAATLGPSIDWLENKKIPRGLGILVIYTALVFVLSMVVVLLIPPIAEQVDQLAATFPIYYERAMEIFGDVDVRSDIGITIQQNIGTVGRSVSEYTGSVFKTVSELFGGLTAFFLLLVLTFYFSVKKDGIKHFIHSVTPEKYQKYVMNVFVRIQDKLGLWLRGQLLLSLIIFLVTWLGLAILGVKYALVLALIAGITEVIPYIGPVIGAIPAVLLTFLQSPVKALFVIILYIVIQQLEGNIIVPKVMQKTIGLNPIVVIVVILLGGKLAGVVGALLAIPIAIAVMEVARDWVGILPEGIIEKKN